MQRIFIGFSQVIVKIAGVITGCARVLTRWLRMPFDSLHPQQADLSWKLSHSLNCDKHGIQADSDILDSD